MIRKLSFPLILLLLSISDVWCKITIQKYLNDNWMRTQPRPPVPVWPAQFTSQFYVYVEKYGEDFHPKGVIYYDWMIKVSYNC